MRSSEQTCQSLFTFIKGLGGWNNYHLQGLQRWWNIDHVLKGFIDSEIINKSQPLSLAGLWRENLCCPDWLFPRVLSNIIPVFTQRSSLSAQRASMNASFFIFPFPDILLNGSIHFLSARHHNHLKSQEKNKERGRVPLSSSEWIKGPELEIILAGALGREIKSSFCTCSCLFGVRIGCLTTGGGTTPSVLPGPLRKHQMTNTCVRKTVYMGCERRKRTDGN